MVAENASNREKHTMYMPTDIIFYPGILNWLTFINLKNKQYSIYSKFRWYNMLQLFLFLSRQTKCTLIIEDRASFITLISIKNWTRMASLHAVIC